MTPECQCWTLECKQGIKQALPSTTPKLASATSSFLGPREGELYPVRNLPSLFRIHPDSDLTGHKSCKGSATGFSLGHKTPSFLHTNYSLDKQGPGAPVLLRCSVAPFLAHLIKIHHHNGSRSSRFDVSKSQRASQVHFLCFRLGSPSTADILHGNAPAPSGSSQISLLNSHQRTIPPSQSMKKLSLTAFPKVKRSLTRSH